ncbi:DUF3833 domain-containing protein [Magnetovibrio sp. PR-2]|uniref:DUF3833 domain-containing protein n=1 Tax=Magnetovibrio sp. PR-2 TaxID=3120356 RepID=UPI002FCE04D1
MKPQDFSQATPKFDLFDYFQGQTQAWGLFEDRFGTVRRQFRVDIQGEVNGDQIILDEHFVYADGETDRRVWHILQTGDNQYEGRADDVIGLAHGQAAGNALNWRYDLKLKVGESSYTVHFNDWMFLQDGGVMINRARVSKWGFEIGEVTLFFLKAANDA